MNLWNFVVTIMMMMIVIGNFCFWVVCVVVTPGFVRNRGRTEEEQGQYTWEQGIASCTRHAVSVSDWSFCRSTHGHEFHPGARCLSGT
jgi:hypothetical protein